MKFKYTYQPTSFDNFYRPYYYVNNKRVTKDIFDYNVFNCKFKGMRYNSSTLICGNRYSAIFYYD